MSLAKSSANLHLGDCLLRLIRFSPDIRPTPRCYPEGRPDIKGPAFATSNIVLACPLFEFLSESALEFPDVFLHRRCSWGTAILRGGCFGPELLARCHFHPIIKAFDTP